MVTEVSGVGELEFNAWKHHPVTKLVWGFLHDYRRTLIDQMLLEWEGGSLTVTTEQEMRGRCMATREVTELEHSAIVAFYHGEQVERTAGEADTDRPGPVHTGYMERPE